MKVLLLGAANSIHLQRWANGLVEAGLRVTCASMHEPIDEGWDPRVALHRLPFRGAAGYVLNAPVLRLLMRSGSFNLLHAHYASGYGLLATSSGLRPRLISVWGSDVYEFPERSWLHRTFLRNIIGRADAVASTSRAMAERLRSVMGRPLEIAITPFGVDTARFAPVPKTGARPGGSGAVVGTVKTLAPVYGIDTLLRAFAMVLTESATVLDIPAPRLRIVGDGPSQRELVKLARELGIEEAVDFVGALPHHAIPAELRSFDIYVAASRQESFGVAVAEASACEVAVIASTAGGLPEVVDDGVTGLLVAADDVPALATALRTLLANPAQRARMGARGRERIVRDYDWSACISKMLACYARLQHGSPTREYGG